MEEPNTNTACLARKLGIRQNQLYKWQKEIGSYGEEAFLVHGNRPARGQLSDETQMLKAKVRRLEAESETLKKAEVYFAKESVLGIRLLMAIDVFIVCYCCVKS